MKKLHKLTLLIILLLGYPLGTPAQNSSGDTTEKVEPTILRRNMVKSLLLNHKQYPDTLSINRESYMFQVEEPLYVSFTINYSTFGTRTEQAPDKLQCQLKVADFSLFSNQVYYQKTKRVHPDSLSLVDFAATLLLTPGKYFLESQVIEERKNPIMASANNQREVAKSGKDNASTLKPFDPDEPLIPLPPPIDPLPPVVPDTPYVKPFSYFANLSILTKGVAPEEDPMPNIPFPAINLGNEPLPQRIGKNAVSIFTSRTGKKEEGMLTINYYDALGRAEETVQQGITPNRKDLISLQEYDGWGRKSNTWLPAAATQNTGDFISPDSCGKLARHTYGGDLYPYLSYVYQNSPLEKVSRQHNPGKAWRDHKRALKTNEYVNIVGNDTLDCFSFELINGAKDTINITASKQYKNGSLLVTRSEDEDGAALFEFKDRLERIVLQRRIESNIKGSKQLSDTYYIYDDFGKLCVVLPPAVSASLTVGNIPAKNLDKYAYLYKYDKAGNLMGKKLPGISWEYYVYNTYNHLLFSQNGEQRQRGEWKFSFPDVLGRICLEGVCKNNIDPFDNSYLSPLFPDFICKYTRDNEYGGYQFRQSFQADLVNPVVNTVNYYDNYDFMYRPGFPGKEKFAYVNEKGFATVSSSAKGMQTGTCKLIVKTCDLSNQSENNAPLQYNHSVMYYDERGRLSQTVSENHLGGMDREYFSYSFTGNILQHLHRQTANSQTTLNDCYTYEYDHAERLVKVAYRTGTEPQVTLISNAYDDLGRLSRKTLHNGLLNTSYSYNIRNWLTTIVDSSFKQSLYYTDGPGTPRYNGNISSMTWKSGKENITKGYRFTYDGLNRLTNAIYGEGTSLAQNLNRFNEQITGYDKMSNILGIKRFGQISSTGYGLIDDLVMTYNGNQLKAVTDKVTTPAYGNGFDFTDGITADTEYEYDANGNMTKDLNKKISKIQYNCLNLPHQIEFQNGSEVSYVYNADGTKLRTIHIIGNDTTVTDYCGKAIYENGIPVKLLTEAGYVTLNDKKYHYFIQDHQGNNRVVVRQDGVVEEVNHYYPFGGLMSASGSNAVQPYKYNGKELDRKCGLDWYDYGARHYDAVLGRWHAVDPVAEKYYNWSPYTYCKNTPVLRVDDNGKDDYTANNAARLSKKANAGKHRLLSSNKRSNPVVTNDNDLLPRMYAMQQDWRNKSKEVYVSTTNIEDAVNIFKFAADNTDVEWRLDVYNYKGTMTAVIGTLRKEDRVFTDKQDELKVKGKKVFDLHSHPYNDIASDRDQELLKIQTGAIYHKDSQTLFFYNSRDSHIKNKHFKERKIEDGKSLYKFLQDYLKTK